ncbi:hypothetical protein F0U60_31355 [Archangium minus]|uniref:Uncharacterized protein n=1 Tax=Archangium minus TaxID=83450 RepID=A0ABY9WYD6_9BACT|nr:hypothetical protein F0U60_31355 [Archangium minus]
MPIYRSLGRLDAFLKDVVLPPGPFGETALRQLFGGIWVLDYRSRPIVGGSSFTVWLALEQELAIPLFVQPGAKLVLGERRSGLTFITAQVDITTGFAITLRDLRIDLQLGDPLGGGGDPTGFSFKGDIRVSNELELTATDIRVTANVPGLFEPGSTLEVAGFHLGRECVALTWSSGFSEEGAAVLLTLRAVFGDPLRELRLDVGLLGTSRTFSLPGVKLQTPDDAQLSLVLGGKDRALTRAALCLTLPPEQGLTLLSDFAWERGEEREVQGDAERPAQEPMLRLGLTANEPVTLMLLDFQWNEAKLPRFLQQLRRRLPALDYGSPASLCDVSDLDASGINPDSWGIHFKFNPDALPFDLPFLKQDRGAPGEQQLLQVRPKTLEVDGVNIVLPVEITVNFGPLSLQTTTELVFNWHTFSFEVKHNEGLKLYAQTEVLGPQEEHLGLRWRFKAAAEPQQDGSTKWHLFTLATKDHNYQLQQAPGAAFEVEYLHVSNEPIVFAITDFALGSKGLNVTATVTDKPARLNGIDTRFRFTDSRLVIIENEIQDFTLSGSGPLPPALVGDAMADISLQLAQRNGALALVSGGARLRGSKLLHCQGTRFEFQIDALGLRFVNEGGFHLYFTLTGSAQFKLAPGDDAEGALALLPTLRIDLVETPLTGDTRVIAKHVRFLIELPRPLSFNFLGAFELELRGIGFVPQADVFDGDPAMLLTGQLKFAQGAGDTPDTRVDYHRLYIGLPKPGSFLPRLHFANLPVALNLGAAFRLNGVVDFEDSATAKGFSGEGTLQIQGLPTFAAAFAFLRVRRDENSPWLRAWFIYLEGRGLSLMIPVVQLYIREVGLGFGYRYTLASIKAADRANDVRKLLAELKTLSRTQGDLSKRDRWALDLEEPGEDPRWTIVLRALISQTSASASPLHYDENAERLIACLFLLDAVIAFRSDLTFFMAVRGWLNANYYDYVSNYKGLRERPFLSGFVLLSPRQKRFLAHVASNPNGQLGPHPPLPEFVEKALQSVQFSATLLVEPGLLHYELGWPNMLRWSQKLGPLQAEMRGGFIWRLSRDEFVTGTSYLARASLEVKAELNLGIVGVRVSASAHVAFGARYIGLLSLRNPLGDSALYGGIGIEAHIRFSIEFWIRLKLGFIKITKTFRFSFGIDFTAGLEVGLVGLSASGVGLRGRGTLSVAVMGRRFHLSVNLGLNEGAVTTARQRTDRVLQYGLEATDVEGIPGTEGATPLRAGEGARALMATAPELAAAPRRASVTRAPFQVPGYSVFVVRDANPDGEHHFVLLPRGERDEDGRQVEEVGFLPVPPPDGTSYDGGYHDFELEVPVAQGETYRMWQYEPLTDDWVERVASEGTIRASWRARWEAVLESGESHPLDATGTAVEGEPTQQDLTLQQYLRNAFVTDDEDQPISDPDPLPGARTVEDERVQNPSDTAFEAAVRGAVEQFRGSPFFKRDPKVEYERLLADAYNDATTIYRADAKVPGDPTEQRTLQKQEQAHQMRGMVVHDMVADLRAWTAAADRNDPELLLLVRKSVAFQMGLVFRVRGTPKWLDDVAEPGEPTPTVRQRLGPDDLVCAGAPMEVRTFNVRNTDFARNPPQFQRVQQLTDARTIALAWDLVWETPPGENLTEAQRSPEHHLVHYHVRRRSLDSNAPETVYTLKGAQTLHRGTDAEGNDVLRQLRPRFQLVDHFNEETLDDLAALPAEGRSYLYTITPYDFAGNAGRPLTLVATRYPSEPPLVPVNAECTVRYRLERSALDVHDSTTPQVVRPDRLFVEWSEPSASDDRPQVPVEKYVLVFRRESSLPIGSYGLDSATQRPRARSLPTSNARPLPTDVRIELNPQGPRQARFAEVTPEELEARGVLPRGAWRPESWRLFLQTVSVNRVPSALAPVQLLLRVERSSETYSGPVPDTERREERRPAELEWLPFPTRLPLLPPEDQRATVGDAHFPMPTPAGADAGADWGRFSSVLEGLDRGELGGVTHQLHPGNLRCIRFRWNQGPSGAAEHPLDLYAGYRLLELDADAHTTETFVDPEKLARALRVLQEVQMLPAEDLALVPGDTLATNQWEAWYPSTLQRRKEPASRAEGSENPLGPWFSWRESILVWPEWPGLTDGGGFRATALHPALQRLVKLLQFPPEGASWPAFVVDLQASPPAQPGSFADFLRVTAPRADPYGWSVLQRLGLSVTLSLRVEPSAANAQVGGEVVGPAELLRTVHAALAWEGVLRGTDETGSPVPDVTPHAHVELLFQPGRAVSLQGAAAPLDGLLARVQVSLRPVVRQTAVYSTLDVEAPAGLDVGLLFLMEQGMRCSLVDAGDPAAGQTELATEPDLELTRLRRDWRVPASGRLRLLLRAPLRSSVTRPADNLPDLGVLLKQPLSAEQRTELAAQFGTWLEYRSEPTPYLIVKQSPHTLEDREGLLELLGATEADAVALILGLSTSTFSVTDERSATFVSTVDELAAAFAPDTGSLAAAQWERLRRYTESLSSTDPALPEAQKIRVPTSGSELKRVLPDVLAWAQRFFDHTGRMDGLTGGDDVAMAPEGPWFATAYPRVGAPAQASPDASGRLTYDHILEDPWAHNYRFYLRPYGRYDLLWDSLRQSPRLYTQLPATPETLPDPRVGGLDVVLDRIRPVDSPLVLFSGRLDAPGTPANPAAPGSTWEVIVGQHEEQALAERNQTLARQLGFRQVAFTLLRAFAFPEWLEQLKTAASLSEPPALDLVEGHWPALPGALPARPTHVDLSRPVGDATARALDLPVRLGAFQRGAQVVQWEALPFYYEHRLLLVAQTNSVVSRLNEVRQRDFEYLAPEPYARVEGVYREGWSSPFAKQGESGVVDLRARGLHIPLRRLWESLPPSARERWSSEAPELGKRKPSWVPDLDTVYQVVESNAGNVEVQAELFFDHQAQQYQVRQLGSRFLASVAGLTLPAAARGSEEDRFVLGVTLVQVTEVELSRPYTDDERAALDDATQVKLEFRGRQLAFAGVMTHADRRALNLLDAADQTVLDRVHDGWYALEPVSGAVPVPGDLADTVDFVMPEELPLSWVGPVSQADAQALRALGGDAEFLRAVETLITAGTGAAPDRVVRASAPRGPEPIPASLQGKAALTRNTEGTAYATVRWTGSLFPEHRTEVARWAQVAALADAMREVAEAMDAADTRRPLPPARPFPSELPPVLADRLVLLDTALRWEGPAPTAAQRTALAALEGDAAFLDARARLLAAIDTDRSVPLAAPPPRRPTQDTLPASINQLILSPTRLEWRGALPTNEQKATCLALTGDPAFVAGVQRLMAQVSDMFRSVDIPAEVVRPEADALPDVLRGQLTYGPGTLRWTAPAPDEAQRAALLALVGDVDFAQAVVALVLAIDADQEVPMEPVVRRPRQEDLSVALNAQLFITPREVEWRGHFDDASQRAALLALPGDAPFLEAVASMVAELDTRVTEVPFTVPVRPVLDAGHPLANQLTLGRALLRHHGLMTREEAGLLRAAFTSGADRASVVRLYEASQAKGMENRALHIRTRRGSARPGEARPLDPLPL